MHACGWSIAMQISRGAPAGPANATMSLIGALQELHRLPSQLRNHSGSRVLEELPGADRAAANPGYTASPLMPMGVGEARSRKSPDNTRRHPGQRLEIGRRSS